MQVFKTFLKIAKKKFPSVLLYYIIFTVIVIAMSMTALIIVVAMVALFITVVWMNKMGLN